MIIKNFLNFVKQNIKIFVIFLLVQIITIVAFFSVFNYGMKFTEDAKQAKQECRTYSFSVSDTSSLDKQMSEFYERYSDKISRFYASVANGEDFFEAVYTSDYYNSKIVNGKNLSSGDLNGGATKMLAKTSIDFLDKNKYPIGSYYELFGKKYEVVGTIISKTSAIPYSSLEDKSVISEISVITNCDMTNLQRNIFADSIKETFNCGQVNLPTDYDMNVYANTINYILMFGIVIFVALFNIVYLYAYMLNRRKYQFAVMRICGCSIDKAVTMYYGEVLILSVVIYAVALIIHLFCVMPVMTGLSDSIRYYISVEQYIAIYLVYLAVETVAFVPIIRKFSKTSPSLLSKD